MLMDSIIEWLKQNYVWLFEGIGGAVLLAFIGWLYKLLFVSRKGEVNKTNNKSSVENSGNNNNTITVNINTPEQKTDVARPIPVPQKLIDPKASIQILFVDDQKFDNVSVLKKAGWINTKSIRDIHRLDAPDILNADVLFIDINDVATDLFPKDQGLGAAVKIKELHPEKYVVVYSANPQFLNDALKKVDEFLPKDADPYQYTNILEKYLGLRNGI